MRVHRTIVGLFMAAAIGIPPAVAQAQTATASANLQTSTLTVLQAQADVLFKRLLVRPDDLDTAFRFAEIETQLGDFEAAIGSLERMLFYNQNLPRVKLELGVLYFRLGSYAMARSYFDGAVAGSHVPDDVREKVVDFDREIDRRLAPSAFAFFGQTGLRYQSNADAGPNSSTVRVLGLDATLSNKFSRQADGNGFVQGTLQHIYDFETQRGDTWETDLSGYYAAQFHVARLDLGLVEIDTGPRLSLGERLSVRPYVLGGDVSLGNAQYLGQGGGGLDLRYVTPNGTQFDVGAEGRVRAFSNSKDYPQADLQRGEQAVVPLLMSGPAFIDNLRWQARLSYVHNSAFARFYSYDQGGIEVSLPYEFQGFFGKGDRRWVLAPFASYFDVFYQAPDGLIDPNVTRRDHLIQGGATLDIPVWGNIGLAVTAQYVVTQSNIPNFRTRDFIVSGGPTIRY